MGDATTISDGDLSTAKNKSENKDRLFLQYYLTRAECEKYLDVFIENEINKDTFINLTDDDLRVLLPGKLGPQKAILGQVHALQILRLQQQQKEKQATENVVRSTFSPNSALRDEDSNFNNAEGKFGSAEGRKLLEQLTAGIGPGPLCEANSTIHELKKYQAQTELETLGVGQAFQKARIHANPIPKTFNPQKVPQAIQNQIEELPIYSLKKELIQAVKDNQMLIVVGETGSGKSTQIPKYLVEAGFGDAGIIGCTQPRRVAAKALAERVSLETGVELGTLVGYSVRFDNCVSGETIIKYMTDGLLVKEFAQGSILDYYSVIMVDEAHERSIHTDVCFGLLKEAAKRRPNLKIIVTSATLDARKFSKYFNNAPVFSIEGKVYPVEIIYEPKSDHDYVQGVIDTVMKIHNTQPSGDILVFLTGQDEIEYVWDKIEMIECLQSQMPFSKTLENGNHDLLILPCYGSLPMEEQSKIFKPTPKGCRKVVLTTNIAETSVTIDGIAYVVDCGRFKQNDYNPKSGMASLVVHKVTKAQAEQRQGRAGRTKAGKAYRLYSEYQYRNLKATAVPEIQRTNVECVILQLISSGVQDILKFDFLDPPNKESVLEALEHLQELGALDPNLKLTSLGRRMSEFPLDPPLAKVLIVSAEEIGCSAEVLKIVALLSIQYQNLFARARNLRQRADSKKAMFNEPGGDHLSLLKVYECWEYNNKSPDWCHHNFIQYRYLAEADDIRMQLGDIMHSYGLNIISCGRHTYKIRKAFCAGYFRRLAKLSLGCAYHTFTNSVQVIRDPVFIHPGSSLFSIKPHPQWVIYHEVVKTKKAYMRGTMLVEPHWLQELAPKFFRKISKYPEISGLML